MQARSLMLMGTGSDVGKSVLVAGLCRLLCNRGLRVLPFKPQNMSNNAAVTADGGEIGRAQALQALACRAEPEVDMNPVLLKPQTDVGAQVVVRGQVVGNASAVEYQTYKRKLPELVQQSFQSLRRRCDIVLVEGAGSPAEVNLRENDIANMGFALPARVPVVLIGDIDRGGVIASLVGTHALLPSAERELIRGFIINKFRGDVSLFDGGRQVISQRTGWTDFGVVPWLPDAARLPAEDAVVLERPTLSEGGRVSIAVPMLSRISNFDDLDPLRAEPQVDVVMVPPGQPLPVCDLVLIPGSKATLSDLAFFRQQRWHVDLEAHVRRGGQVWGVCGGMQMLGRRVSDPVGMEGAPGSVEGLGLLDIETSMGGSKHLLQVSGKHLASGCEIRGYEMHLGDSVGADLQRALFAVRRGDEDRAEGAMSPDGRVAGTYLHGVFGSDGFRRWFLEQFAIQARMLDFSARVDQALDGIAEQLERHLAIDELLDAAC